MSRTRNANSILVGNTSEETVGARKAAQVLAATIFAALFAVPVASAVETTLPWQPTAPPSPFAATPQLPSNVHTPGVQSEPGAPPAPRAPHRIYLLGSFAHTSTLSPAKVKAKTKASTVLKPTAVKIAANPTGGSANKVQQVFSIH
jgi:hypothetical protein